MTVVRKTYKNREREYRGITKEFSELPISAQNDFIAAKEYVKSIDKRVEDVYVYGSYHWGFYDSESDYDIVLDGSLKTDFPCDKYVLNDRIKKDININVDMLYISQKTIEINDLIKIP